MSIKMFLQKSRQHMLMWPLKCIVVLGGTSLELLWSLFGASLGPLWSLFWGPVDIWSSPQQKCASRRRPEAHFTQNRALTSEHESYLGHKHEHVCSHVCETSISLSYFDIEHGQLYSIKILDKNTGFADITKTPISLDYFSIKNMPFKSARNATNSRAPATCASH